MHPNLAFTKQANASGHAVIAHSQLTSALVEEEAGKECMPSERVRL